MFESLYALVVLSVVDSGQWWNVLIIYVLCTAVGYAWLGWEAYTAPMWIDGVGFVPRSCRGQAALEGKGEGGLPSSQRKENAMSYRNLAEGQEGPALTVETALALEPMEASEWGREADVVQLLDLNCIFKAKGDEPAHSAAIGVDDAWIWQCEGDDVLLSKANAVATYLVDSIQAQPVGDRLFLRTGTWLHREDDGAESGLDYQDMAYCGRYLVQWRDLEVRYH